MRRRANQRDLLFDKSASSAIESAFKKMEDEDTDFEENKIGLDASIAHERAGDSLQKRVNKQKPSRIISKNIIQMPPTCFVRLPSFFDNQENSTSHWTTIDMRQKSMSYRWVWNTQKLSRR
jgi:hypothetical protein